MKVLQLLLLLLLGISETAQRSTNDCGTILRVDGPSSALVCYASAAALEPTVPKFLYNLGVVSAMTGDRFRAIQSFRSTLELNPNHAASLVNLGGLLAEVGETEASNEKLLQAARMDSAEVRETALTTISNNYLLLGRLDEALNAVEGALRVAPLDLKLQAGADKLLSQIISASSGERIRDPDVAIRAARLATRFVPLQSDAQYQLGVLLSKAGRHLEARAHLITAVRLQPTDADHHKDLGHCLLQHGHHDEAIRSYEQGLHLLHLSGSSRGGSGSSGGGSGSSGGGSGSSGGGSGSSGGGQDSLFQLEFALAVAMGGSGRQAEAHTEMVKALRLRPMESKVLHALAEWELHKAAQATHSIAQYRECMRQAAKMLLEVAETTAISTGGAAVAQTLKLCIRAACILAIGHAYSGTNHEGDGNSGDESEGGMLAEALELLRWVRSGRVVMVLEQENSSGVAGDRAAKRRGKFLLGQAGTCVGEGVGKGGTCVGLSEAADVGTGPPSRRALLLLPTVPTAMQTSISAMAAYFRSLRSLVERRAYGGALSAVATPPELTLYFASFLPERFRQLWWVHDWESEGHAHQTKTYGIAAAMQLRAKSECSAANSDGHMDGEPCVRRVNSTHALEMLAEAGVVTIPSAVPLQLVQHCLSLPIFEQQDTKEDIKHAKEGTREKREGRDHPPGDMPGDMPAFIHSPLQRHHYLLDHDTPAVRGLLSAVWEIVMPIAEKWFRRTEQQRQCEIARRRVYKRRRKRHKLAEGYVIDTEEQMHCHWDGSADELSGDIENGDEQEHRRAQLPLPRMMLAELAAISVFNGAKAQVVHADTSADLLLGESEGGRSREREQEQRAAGTTEKLDTQRGAAEGGLLSIFVTLGGQTAAGGALQVWPGSHLNAFNNIEPEGTMGGEGERLPCHDHPPELGVRLPMPAGSIIVYTSRLVHRGSAHSDPAAGPRHTLMLSVALDTDAVPAPATRQYALLPRYGDAHGGFRVAMSTFL
jgi:tetratricopeptide (TPR) repeat protein